MRLSLRKLLSAVLLLCLGTATIYSEPDEAKKTATDADILAYSNNELGFEVYSQLDIQDNIVFSPYSLATALQMLYAGSAEFTQSQMTRVLHFGTDPEALNSSAEALRDALGVIKNRRVENEVYLSVANSLWFQTGHRIMDKFEETITTKYGGIAKSVDFRVRSDKARFEMNQWVKDRTQGKITDLIPIGSFSNMTRLVLINAMYMQGTWQHTFDPQYTRMFPFFPSSLATLTVPMMTLTDTFGFVKENNYTALSLDYATKLKSRQFAMVLILPTDTFGLKAVESTLTALILSRILNKLEQTKVAVTLPKFKISVALPLKGPLMKMGLLDPFSIGADFSAIDGSKDLYLSDVFQKAFISIDEKGTEAGVATGISISAKSIELGPPELFKADHPFLFFIVEKLTGSILFMGRVVTPETGT